LKRIFLSLAARNAPEKPKGAIRLKYWSNLAANSFPTIFFSTNSNTQQSAAVTGVSNQTSAYPLAFSLNHRKKQRWKPRLGELGLIMSFIMAI
jgi:hypothetical protein